MSKASNDGKAISKLILASASPRRVELLEQIGITPYLIRPVGLDETPKKLEIPRNLCKRLAKEKALECQNNLPSDLAVNLDDNQSSYHILASDTVVGVGRRILGKAQNIEQARNHLILLSGRSHRVFTSVSIVDAHTKKHRQKTVETRVRFKRLSTHEIDSYLATGEWRDKAGSYAIQGYASAFIVNIIGQYSNVVGLPLFETTSLLRSAGIDPIQTWPKHAGQS